MTQTAPPRQTTAPTLSIRDFLTDGALASLCAEVASLTGVPVSLHDPDGRRIRPGDVGTPWIIDDLPETPEPGATDAAMIVGDLVIGAIRVAGSGPARGPAERMAALLASTAGEFCRHDLELRHHVKEVTALAQLSSLLARATNVDDVLQIALDSALDVLSLHAGSIVLFDDETVTTDNEEDLVLKASRNLSREWLDSPLPASRGRVFDRQALRGELVVSEDLRADDRVFIPEMVEREGLRSFINCGLLFRDRALGVIRLYSRTARAFSESDRRLLRAIAHQAAVAVEQARLLKLQERDAILYRQLQLAADVQRRMLPRHVPTFQCLDVAARYAPSFELGGDFYDLFELGASLGVAIGDVVGKGMAAALLMSAVRASLRAHVQDLYDIDEVLSRVNAALCRDTLENEFATVWYGVVDPRLLRLTYCSAGHEPPFVVRAPEGRAAAQADVVELPIGGMAVGIDPAQIYHRGVFDLRPGDVLVAFTDGLPDTLGFGGQRFGKARLRAAVLSLLAAEPDAGANRILEHVFWELRQFAGILERPDDQTVVIVRVRAC